MSRRGDQYYSICLQVFAALGRGCYTNHAWVDTEGPVCKWNSTKMWWLSGVDPIFVFFPTPYSPPTAAAIFFKCAFDWQIPSRKEKDVAVTTAPATPAWIRASDKYHSDTLKSAANTERSLYWLQIFIMSLHSQTSWSAPSYSCFVSLQTNVLLSAVKTSIISTVSGHYSHWQ